MKKLMPVPFLLLLTIVGCTKVANQTAPNTTPNSPNNAPQTPPVNKGVDSAVVMNDYDAAYTHNTIPFYTFSYHVRQVLHFYKGRNYQSDIYLYNATDTFYHAYTQPDTATAQKKGCFALISNVDTSQQANYSYYIGNYYRISLFSDSAVGNVQFMVPANAFPSIDTVRLDSMYYYAGGVNSFYAGMANAEVKILPDYSDFVRSGDNFSYANAQIPAQGMIDSAEVHLYVTRFSDNGIHPNPNITKTIDANYGLNLFFHDGSYFTLINGKFTNLFFQQTPM